MVWKQEEVCNRGIYPGREATSFYCRTSGIALSMREEEFFLSSQRSSHIPSTSIISDFDIILPL